MSDVDILLNSNLVESKLIESADRIINMYSLEFQLTRKEILYGFFAVRTYIFEAFFLRSDMLYIKYKNLFCTLLNMNKNMFIAIIKFLRTNTDVYYSKPELLIDMDYCIGFQNGYPTDIIVLAYMRLIDEHDFSVDDLKLPEDAIILINEYRNEKRSSKTCKPVLNFAC